LLLWSWRVSAHILSFVGFSFTLWFKSRFQLRGVQRRIKGDRTHSERNFFNLLGFFKKKINKFSCLYNPLRKISGYALGGAQHVGPEFFSYNFNFLGDSKNIPIQVSISRWFRPYPGYIHAWILISSKNFPSHVLIPSCKTIVNSWLFSNLHLFFCYCV